MMKNITRIHGAMLPNTSRVALFMFMASWCRWIASLRARCQSSRRSHQVYDFRRLGATWLFLRRRLHRENAAAPCGGIERGAARSTSVQRHEAARKIARYERLTRNGYSLVGEGSVEDPPSTTSSNPYHENQRLANLVSHSRLGEWIR